MAVVKDTGGSRSSSKEASTNSSSVFLGQVSSCRIMDQGEGGRAVTRGKGHVLVG